MKIKNIILAIKDQLPLSRLIRNMRKGHLIGLFDKRSHFTKEGKEKVKYNTKATAVKSAQKMMEKNGFYYSNYKCIYCDGYHIGRNMENKSDV
jgi:hypothetical protein